MEQSGGPDSTHAEAAYEQGLKLFQGHLNVYFIHVKDLKNSIYPISKGGGKGRGDNPCFMTVCWNSPTTLLTRSDLSSLLHESTVFPIFNWSDQWRQW